MSARRSWKPRHFCRWRCMDLVGCQYLKKLGCGIDSQGVALSQVCAFCLSPLLTLFTIMIDLRETIFKQNPSCSTFSYRLFVNPILENDYYLLCLDWCNRLSPRPTFCPI